MARRQAAVSTSSRSVATAGSGSTTCSSRPDRPTVSHTLRRPLACAITRPVGEGAGCRNIASPVGGLSARAGVAARREPGPARRGTCS
jgi:hypothetical protein